MQWLRGYKSRRSYIDTTKANQLLHNLTPDFVMPSDLFFTSKNPTLDKNITLQEFEKAIRSKNTSLGYDNISYSMIKHLPENGKQILLLLYNKFYTLGFVPK